MPESKDWKKIYGDCDICLNYNQWNLINYAIFVRGRVARPAMICFRCTDRFIEQVKISYKYYAFIFFALNQIFVNDVTRQIMKNYTM